MLITEKNLRTLIRETLLLEELTKSDKKEIEKIARKQFDKQPRAQASRKKWKR